MCNLFNFQSHNKWKKRQQVNNNKAKAKDRQDEQMTIYRG